MVAARTNVYRVIVVSPLIWMSERTSFALHLVRRKLPLKSAEQFARIKTLWELSCEHHLAMLSSFSAISTEGIPPRRHDFCQLSMGNYAAWPPITCEMRSRDK